MVEYKTMNDEEYAEFLDRILAENRPTNFLDESALGYLIFNDELAEASRRIKALVEDNKRLSSLSQPQVIVGGNSNAE